MISTFDSEFREDATHSFYSRITARDGSGEAIPGEGKCLTQADVDEITYRVNDVGSTTTLVSSGTVTVVDSVFDDLQTTDDDPVWKRSKGFNFRHDLGPSNFPTGGRFYVVEYKIATVSGDVGFLVFRGPAREVFTS